MITDRFGPHEVLLPINHDYNKICDTLGFFKFKHKNFREFFVSDEKSNLSARVRWLVLSNYLLSPTRFVWLAHTSTGSFTMQLRVPVYIPKNELKFTLNTQHLRIWGDIGTANRVVIRLGKVWHICNVFGPPVLAQEVRRSAAHWYILFEIFVKNILLSMIFTHTCGPCGPVAPRSPLSPCRPCILKIVN